ncbi:hypothetical protein F8388_020802 [Cannabis sativa]|uniref:F-box domain-containing protein n=1 Tax=Cannabis sativa TaxID=3483 RepID=A0A7J6EUB0_CANSA|nr:hypothetical protein G4B88_007147 [Cannabis sativa]KAF4363232.1 hypothetical protein F8388_020802 [Cannabis sativa]
MNHNKQWSSALVSPYEQAREKENKIENLPMEIVGKIFDQIGEARHVVVASATCKMWRKVWKDYTCALSFNSNMYRDFHTSTFEVIIAQTISQTRGLKSLSIVMEYDHEDQEYLSSELMVACLMHTHDSLRQLHYSAKTTPNMNFINTLCSAQKLEDLVLSFVFIFGFNPSHHKFHNLKSLSLNYNFFVEDINMAKFIISKVDCLENLHIKNCAIEFFKLVCKGALKTLEIDSSDLININIIGNTNNFESVDVYNSTIMWSSIYSMLIKKSSKIKRIKLCYVDFYEEDDEDIDMENLSSSTMALFMSMNNNNVMVLIGKSKEEFDLEN